ncbi:hypothetical protein TrCOL_g6230 [Triparma columacea]|uniref:Spermatogenesis-associated protein 4 n=1 Tax=Triparma columacea TaxID=722753 RepID=A0A9W7G3D9_9STRA|nr:hypothetical protein TrCOL_g6230 [Triparma columacea]
MSGNPNSLSREVLRWIQSLDLAYSIKNPKRDFSNGFLVAEIFSRYFVRGISMHSYDNGTAIRVKKNNWGQLLKFFRKQGLDMITGDEVTAIIHCEDGAVATFIKRIYQALTQREVQTVDKRPPLEKLPPYMRTTGSKVVKDKLRTGNFTEHPDQTTTQAALEASLDSHEAELQLERSVDPDRFSAISLSGSRAPHQPKRMGEQEAPVPQVTVERIVVKQSDRNIAQLRASQDPMAARFNSSIGSAGSTGGSASSPPPAQSFSAQAAVQKGVQDILDSALVESGFEDAESFSKALIGGDPAAVEASGEVFYSLYNDAMKIASAAVAAPNDFWVMSNFFMPLISSLPVDGDPFKASVDAFSSVGLCLLKVKPSAAPALFSNYALEALCGCLGVQPTKSYALLSLYYSFSPPTPAGHVEAIKKLTETIAEPPLLVTALSNLINVEDEGSIDNAVMDLYLYYSIIGLGQSSPSVRASSLAMLASAFSRGGIGEVGQFVEPLTNLAKEDSYWESKCQLLVVASIVLGNAEEINAEVKEAFVKIIEEVFSTKSSGKVKKVGIAYLAPVLGADLERLLPPFLSVLLGMKQVDRMSLLGLTGGMNVTGGRTGALTELNVGGTSGLKYSIQRMNGLDVAKGLLDFVNSNEVFYEEHACTLLGCVTAAEGDMGGNNWQEVWDGFVGVLTDSLLVEGVAETAGDVIFTMLAGNEQVAKSVTGGEPLRGIMEDIFKEEGGEVCKENFVQLLTRISGFSPSGCKYVEELLEKGEDVVKGDDDLLNLQADLRR